MKGAFRSNSYRNLVTLTRDERLKGLTNLVAYNCRILKHDVNWSFTTPPRENVSIVPGNNTKMQRPFFKQSPSNRKVR